MSELWRRVRTAAFVLSICLLFAGVAQSAEQQTIKGHVPAAVSGRTPVDRLATNRQLHLSITLPLRNRENLTNLLQKLYDPKNPSYHHFLNPGQFTAAFGPTEQDYQAVVNFARASGFNIISTHPNRTLVEVTASVADIEKAFHVNLRVYPHPTEHRNFYSPDVEPSLDLDVPILSIAGLNNFLIPHPTSLHAMRPNPEKVAQPNGGSEIQSTYVGLDFRAAYVPGVALTGSGQSVGLMEFDSYYPTDVTDYINDSKSGLSGTSVALSNVISGSIGSPGAGNVEVALDIEMAISMAPGLSAVYVYEAPNDTSYADVILNRMATNTQCRQLSSSWSGFLDSGVEQAFLQFQAQGQSFFEAAGDSGAYFPAGNPMEPPCDDPNITVVGGTTLSTTGPQGSWTNETTWNWYTTGIYTGQNGTSGGISPTYSIPSWQSGVSMASNSGSANFRNIPDVAMVADAIYVIADDGISYLAGGTSAATPLWAGLTALINQQNAALGQQPVGFLNPAIYKLAQGSNYLTCFHDITTGNNTNFNSEGDNNTNNSSYTENFVNTNLFFAVPGFDLCTGWGTPVGSNLINLLAPTEFLTISPLTGFSESATYGGPFPALSQTYTLTNSGLASIDWTVTNVASWLVSSSSGGVLPPGQTTNFTISLNTNAANSFPAGTYTTNVSIIDVTDGITQIRPFTVVALSTQLVQNGGFENGSFADWSLTGPSDASKDNVVASASDVSVFGFGHNKASAATIASYIYAGNYSALLGESGADAYLSQTLPTMAGQSYVVSFWVANSGLLSGGVVTPNALTVNWNGTPLYSKVNLPGFTWTNVQFLATAGNSSTVLQFGARNDNDFFGLDNITVQAISAPVFSNVSINTNTVTLNWNGLAGWIYELQYTTNLPTTNWTTLNSYILDISGRVTAHDVAPPDSQRFYRVILLEP